MNKKILSILISGALFSTSTIASDFKIEVNSLHYAVSINEIDYVTELILDEPNLASQFNKEGLTPLHLAISLDSLTSLKGMLDKKINPNIKNSVGETPLIYAVKNKKKKAVKILLNNGANKKIEDLTGKTAIDYAKMNGEDMLSLFVPEKSVANQKINMGKLSKKIEDMINKKLNPLLIKNKVLNDKVNSLSAELEKSKNFYNSELSIIKEEKDLLEIKLSDIEVIVKNSKNSILTLSNKKNDISLNKAGVFQNKTDLVSLLVKIKKQESKIKEFENKEIIKTYVSQKETKEFKILDFPSLKKTIVIEEEFKEIDFGKGIPVELKKEPEDSLNLIIE